MVTNALFMKRIFCDNNNCPTRGWNRLGLRVGSSLVCSLGKYNESEPRFAQPAKRLNREPLGGFLGGCIWIVRI